MHLGPVSIYDKTSYREISQSFDGARSDVKRFVSLCVLTSTSAAVLPSCLSNFRAIGQVQIRFPLLRDFAISYNKTSYRILKQDQGGSVLISQLEMFSINSRDHDLIFLTTSRHGYASTLLALCGDSSTQVDSPHIMFRLFVLNHMMTSSNGTIFRVTGHFCGEFTGPRWLPRTKASDAKLWWFLWSASE